MGNPKLEIDRSNIQRVFSFTDEIVKQFPNRLAGTKACQNAANRIREAFISNCDQGAVQIEEFIVHPKSFLKHMPGLVVLYITCSILLYFQFPLPAFIGYSLGIFVFYSQLVRYWEIFDPLFPRATGYNVLGTIEPEGDVRQQVIISAHHDAAYVFQLIARIPRYYAKFIRAGILVLVFGFLVSLVGTMLAIFHIPLPGWIPLILIGGSVLLLPLAFFTTGEVSPAAGDNMIAVAIASETAKLFQDAKKSGTNPLRHTRLMVASFDAEEAGLRGARAFCKKHAQELLSTKTYVLNIDTLYKVKDLSFLHKDLNSRVRISHEMAQDCVDIAKSLGYSARVSRMPSGAGSTDAAEFGKIGVEATTMLGISFDINQLKKGIVYHTPNDLSQHIEPKIVEAALSIARDYILKKDGEFYTT